MGQVGDGALASEEAVALTASNKLESTGQHPLEKDRRHVEVDLKLGGLPFKAPAQR